MTTTRSCVKRYLRATSGSTQEMPVLSALLKLFEAVCENQADRETHEKTSAFSVIESLFWLTETENYRVKRVAYRCRRQANLSPWKSRLGAVPLTVAPTGYAIGGGGRVVDWLVVMRRLDESQTLEALLFV